MKYRNRTEIIAEMLEAASMPGITKTKIMYKAYVPHAQMSNYIQILVENALLSFDQETRNYQTTLKGQHYLDAYNFLHGCIAHPS